jgi:hypothetical protein
MKTFVFAPPDGHRLCRFPWELDTPLFLPRRSHFARGVSSAAVCKLQLLRTSYHSDVIKCRSNWAHAKPVGTRPHAVLKRGYEAQLDM